MRNFILSLSAGAVLSTLIAVDNADADNRRDRFRVGKSAASEGPGTADRRRGRRPPGITEAPTGFDGLTNGYLDQGPAYETLTEDTVVALRSYNDNRFIFEEVETIADGIGPVYNAQSCRECHENVVTGGASQITEHRTGHLNGDDFFESLGGSLIQSRATHAEIVERVAYEDDIRTFRLSTSLLGAGFVEALANDTLLQLRDAQPVAMRGTAVLTPVLEAPGTTRIGRFGWKSQHGSLVSFSADAYLNEMGITSPLLPEENTSSGMFVGYGTEYDRVADPEDDGNDLIRSRQLWRQKWARIPHEFYTRCRQIRRLLSNRVRRFHAFDQGAVARSHNGRSARGRGAVREHRLRDLPRRHSRDRRARHADQRGGTFKIPAALGNKAFHPYSDFLMHDIGTGDGIPVQPTPEFAGTAKQIRTAPLWGLRTRNRLMHDGLTFTKQEAIARHAGQAAPVTAAYRALSEADRQSLLKFIESL